MTVAAFPQFWATSTFRWAMLSATAVWLAFPPVGLWPLAWVAPIGWLRLIRMPELDGRHPYVLLYVAGYLHWLLMTQWIRLPHWSAGIGWFFLAAYLASYVPLFVGLTRILIHRWGLSPVLAAPTTWVALELARGYVLEGFSLALLAHSQVAWLPILQLASLTGAYGISFLIVFIAAAVERTIRWQAGPPVRWPWGVATCVMAAAYGYGQWVLQAKPQEPNATATVALIQGSADTEFDQDEKEALAWIERTFHEYRNLSLRAVNDHRGLDLLIWPESMFATYCPIVRYDEGEPNPSYWQQPYTVEEMAAVYQHEAAKWVRELGTSCLMGTLSRHYRHEEVTRYNTAGFYGPEGKLWGTYDKMQPVMFGEYIPLGEVFPWLYQLTVLENGLGRGREPVSFQAGGVWFSPCICFENTVPHLVRRHVSTLGRRGERVDALVTLTNDGWFLGVKPPRSPLGLRSISGHRT